MSVSSLRLAYDRFALVDEYTLPSWVPGVIRERVPSYMARPVQGSFYPLVHFFQWMKVVSVVKAVNEARLACGFGVSSSTSRVWTVLRHAPLALFFVPRGDLSKYKFVKPLAFVRDHWTHISMGIQLVASVALFAVGDYARGGGAIIGLSCQIIQEFDAVPQKVRSCVAIVESVASNCIFYVPSILNYRNGLVGAAFSLAQAVYFVKSVVEAEKAKRPQAELDLEVVVEVDQIRPVDLVYNPKLNLEEMWHMTFGSYQEEVSVMVAKIEGCVISDRPYLELMALLLVLNGIDIDYEPLKGNLSAKEECAKLLPSVVKRLSEEVFGEDECVKASWLLAYRSVDLNKIGYSYVWEQVMGSLEEQQKTLWKAPVGGDDEVASAMGLLQTFKLYAADGDDKKDWNRLKLLKAGIIVQKKAVEKRGFFQKLHALVSG